MVTRMAQNRDSDLISSITSDVMASLRGSHFFEELDKLLSPTDGSGLVPAQRRRLGVRGAMKKIAIVGIGLLLSIAFNSTGQTSKAAPFSISIRAQQSIVKPAQPIVIILTTKNISGQSIRLGETNPGMEYDFDVRDAHGQPVAEKELLKRLKHSTYVFRSTSEVLKPGVATQETFAISDYFDFTKPELYSIQVQRLVPYSLGHGAVKSNSITITVTPC
jgi:hypothetical protein